MPGPVGLWWSTLIRDLSLITGRGGYKTEGEGHVKFYPYEKGGQKVLAMLNNKFWGNCYVVD